jgi:hypothetical protein
MEEEEGAPTQLQPPLVETSETLSDGEGAHRSGRHQGET